MSPSGAAVAGLLEIPQRAPLTPPVRSAGRTAPLCPVSHCLLLGLSLISDKHRMHHQVPLSATHRCTYQGSPWDPDAKTLRGWNLTRPGLPAGLRPPSPQQQTWKISKEQCSLGVHKPVHSPLCEQQRTVFLWIFRCSLRSLVMILWDRRRKLNSLHFAGSSAKKFSEML